MAEIPLSWKLGIDHVSRETNLPHGAVRDCVNVDIDRNGTLDRRDGYSRIATGRAHSLWTAADGRTFCVVDGALYSVKYDGTTATLTVLKTLRSDAPVSYDDLNSEVVYGNHDELGVIGDAVRALGVEDPSPPALSVSAGVGALAGGTYGVLVTFLRGAEESAASSAAFVTIADGDGLSVTLPIPGSQEVTGIRVYRTQANGDVFYRAGDFPAGGLHTYIIGANVVGRQADTRFMQRLPGGHIVRYWRGRLLVARGRHLLFSESLRYGLWTPTENFVQFSSPIRVMQPVEGGVFVGTRDGVVFLSGQSPDAWEQRRTGAKPPVDGSGLKVATSTLGGERDYGGAYAALWLAENGFVIGTADGSLVEPQSKRISLPESQVAAGVGASVVHERRVLTSIN